MKENTSLSVFEEASCTCVPSVRLPDLLLRRPGAAAREEEPVSVACTRDRGDNTEWRRRRQKQLSCLSFDPATRPSFTHVLLLWRRRAVRRRGQGVKLAVDGRRKDGSSGREVEGR